MATGAGLIMAGLVSAEIEGELHAGWNTEYIWRGIDQGGSNMIEAGIDAGMPLGDTGFSASAGIWYASVNGDGGGDEVDYYGGISRDFALGSLETSVEVGYIYYDFPNGRSGSSEHLEEVYFSVGTTLMDAVDLGFVYFWDIDGDNDGYSELTADYTHEINDCWAANIGGVLSYDWETSDLHHFGLSLSLDYAFNDVLTISPYVAATWAEDGAQDGALSISSSQDDELFGGIILTAAF